MSDHVIRDRDFAYMGSPDRCWLCLSREFDHNVTLEGVVRGICGTCWERGQDEIRIPLDMTEDDDE